MYTNIIHNDDICNYFLKNQQFIFNSLGNCRECRTEISLERDAEGHIGCPVSRGCITVARMVNENQ